MSVPRPATGAGSPQVPGNDARSRHHYGLARMARRWIWSELLDTLRGVWTFVRRSLLGPGSPAVQEDQTLMSARDIESAQEFCALNGIELRSERPMVLRITVHRPCLTINRAGQLELASQITLDVRFDRHYPAEPFEVTVPGGTPHPFHPHFSVALMDFRGAERLGRMRLTTPRWYDYQEPRRDETLGEFLYRICQSLSFDPAYIDAQPTRAVNPDAARWYQDKRRDGQMRFPLVEPARRPESPQSPRLFRIIEEIRPQEPAVAARPRGETILATSPRESDRHAPALYIRAAVIDRIFEHIGWGQRTAVNGNEQGGILVGRVLRDAGTNEPYTVVDHAIPAESADGSAAYLRMDHATWSQMLDRVDALLTQADRSLDARIVGWYHTHPNDLPVFMSGTDRRTQCTFFAHPSSVALVLNPHKQLWRAFFGADCAERRAVVYRPAENGDS